MLNTHFCTSKNMTAPHLWCYFMCPKNFYPDIIVKNVNVTYKRIFYD